MRRFLRLLPYTFILIFGFLLAVIIYPSAIIAPARTLPDDNDTRLIAYIIGQVQNNLFTRKPLFFGTYFAPYPNTLAYSEPFVTSAVISLPFRLFTSNPIVIFNLVYLLGSTLTFFTAFLFFKYNLAGYPKALLATSIFFLSGFHLSYLPHLQIYSLWPTFLALYFFLRFQRQNKALYLHLFYLSTFLQLADSLLPVYFIFIACFIFWLSQPRRLFYILLSSLPFLLATFVFLSPHLTIAKTFPESVRPIRDAAHFSLGLEEIFTKYSSWTIILLLIISWKRTTSKVVHHFLLFTGLILSLGPVIKLFGHTIKIFGWPIPLPYTIFYYLLPGFTTFRTPSRFIILALVGASAIISPAIATKLRTGRRIQTATLSLIFSLLLLEARLPKPSYQVDPTPPPVYKQVKNLPADSVILELPIKLWNQPGHQIESIRSLYSLYHQHRRVGGFSGFAPQDWINLVNQTNTTGPYPEAMARLQSIGVTHIVENNRLTPLLDYYQ